MAKRINLVDIPDNQRKEHVGAGIVLTNGDDEGLVDAALRISRDLSLRTEMGLKAQKLLQQKFSVEAAADEILSMASTGV